jgi:hypothetical protein
MVFNLRMKRFCVFASDKSASIILAFGIYLMAALCCLPASADERDQARRIHDRLAGVPPSDQVLDDMEADILGGNALAAANRALSNSAFYTVTLKNFATPWTNRDQDVFADLNDYTATVIGMVRDDVPFNTLLSADLVYIGDPNLGLPAYSMTNNDHYVALEQQGIDLQNNLVSRLQTQVTDLPGTGVAGVMTTRAAAKAFFVAGTNRAMFRFTMLNHMCNDMEQVKDTTRIPDRIRQDVSRSPGGDSRIFMNNCIGCHNGMDPMAQAFAYYNYDELAGRIVYTPGQVQPKYFINADNFKYGYITPDDRWDNYWRSGPNALLGWDNGLSGSGNGAASMGSELANSDAFARCQVTKVFRNVCFRDPVDGTDRSQIDTMVSSFKGGGYRMKQVFAEAAVYCRGS